MADDRRRHHASEKTASPVRLRDLVAQRFLEVRIAEAKSELVERLRADTLAGKHGGVGHLGSEHEPYGHRRYARERWPADDLAEDLCEMRVRLRIGRDDVPRPANVVVLQQEEPRRDGVIASDPAQPLVARADLPTGAQTKDRQQTLERPTVGT